MFMLRTKTLVSARLSLTKLEGWGDGGGGDHKLQINVKAPVSLTHCVSPLTGSVPCKMAEELQEHPGGIEPISPDPL